MVKHIMLHGHILLTVVFAVIAICLFHCKTDKRMTALLLLIGHAVIHFLERLTVFLFVRHSGILLFHVIPVVGAVGQLL